MMPSRRVLLSLGLVAFTAALLLWAASPESAYPDAWYYRTAAREILEGRGGTIPYLWSYVATGGAIDPSGALPLLAFDHWMPLAALIAVPSLLLVGATPLGHALPYLLCAAALAPLTAGIAARAGFGPRRALLAGTLAAVPGPFLWWVTRSDNFALYALLGGLAIWLLADLRDGRRPQRSALLAGLLIGLATLSRTDGLLLLLLLPLALWPRLRAQPARAVREGALATLGLAVVLGPWLVRQIAVFGAPFPSAAGGRILWIRDYQELWGAGGPLGPEHLLGWDPARLLLSRLDALGYVVSTAPLYLAVALLLPLLLLGLRPLWRSGGTHLRLLCVGFVLHACWSVLVAAPHVQSGNYIHGLLLYLPLTIIAIIIGADLLAARLAERGLAPLAGRSEIAARLVLPLTGLIWLAMSLLLAVGILLPAALRQAERDRLVARAVDEMPLAVDAVVAALDPGAVYTLTGQPAILLPQDTPARISQALAAYRIRAVLVESRDRFGSAWAAGSGLSVTREIVLPDGGTLRLYLLP